MQNKIRLCKIVYTLKKNVDHKSAWGALPNTFRCFRDGVGCPALTKGAQAYETVTGSKRMEARATWSCGSQTLWHIGIIWACLRTDAWLSP